MFSLIAQVARFFRSSTASAPASHAAALMESADMRIEVKFTSISFL